MRQSKIIGYFYNNQDYLIFRLKNMKCIPAHVYIYQFHYGKIPKGFQVHHKDGNVLNNCIDNLELLTIKDNLDKRVWS